MSHPVTVWWHRPTRLSTVLLMSSTWLLLNGSFLRFRYDQTRDRTTAYCDRGERANHSVSGTDSRWTNRQTDRDIIIWHIRASDSTGRKLVSLVSLGSAWLGWRSLKREQDSIGVISLLIFCRSPRTPLDSPRLPMDSLSDEFTSYYDHVTDVVYCVLLCWMVLDGVRLRSIVGLWCWSMWRVYLCRRQPANLHWTQGDKSIGQGR